MIPSRRAVVTPRAASRSRAPPSMSGTAPPAEATPSYTSAASGEPGGQRADSTPRSSCVEHLRAPTSERTRRRRDRLARAGTRAAACTSTSRCTSAARSSTRASSSSPTRPRTPCYRSAPYAARGTRDKRNADDSIYVNGGSKGLLKLDETASAGSVRSRWASTPRRRPALRARTRRPRGSRCRSWSRGCRAGGAARSPSCSPARTSQKCAVFSVPTITEFG